MTIRALLALTALVAAPLAAQDTPMSYGERITCGALLFMSSQSAEDPTIERQFAAHHITMAIEMSGKSQDVAIADTQRRMDELTPAWEREDETLMQTYSQCIMTVMSELGG